MDHWLWDKYVTFVQGKSLDAHVMAKVSRMVQDVDGPVLVVLDADHAEEAVYQVGAGREGVWMAGSQAARQARSARLSPWLRAWLLAVGVPSLRCSWLMRS